MIADLTTRVFGRLKPLSTKPVVWECQCDCGAVCQKKFTYEEWVEIGKCIRRMREAVFS